MTQYASFGKLISSINQNLNSYIDSKLKNHEIGTGQISVLNNKKLKIKHSKTQINSADSNTFTVTDTGNILLQRQQKPILTRLRKTA